MDLQNIKKIAGLLEESNASVVKPRENLNEDFQSMLKIAGISDLYEAYDYSDDDDDEDVAKAEAEAKKRKIALPKVEDISDDDEEDKPKVKAGISSGASEEAKKKAEAKKGQFWNVAKKAEPKKAEPKKEEAKKKAEAKKADETSDEKPVAKRKGKAPSEVSNRQQLLNWLRKHPNAPRKEAWAFNNTLEKPYTTAGFNTIHHTLKSIVKNEMAQDTKECYVIAHPHMNSFILHENREMRKDQWVSESDISELEPYVFATEAEATNFAERVREYQGQSCVVKHIVLED